VGIAFLMMYIFHTVVTWLAARRLSGFRWSAVNLSRLIWLLPAVLAAFLFTLTLPTLWAVLIGGMLALLVGLYSLRSLYTLVGPEVAQAYIQRIWARLGLKERGPHE
jgi:PST family polysaccharide transporter